MKLKSFFYKSTKSTNDIAMKKIRKGFLKGIVISEMQSNGRGTYGKKWIGIKGNLFTTIFFQINDNFNIKKITRINCMIVKKSLQGFINKEIKFKYPNDLLVKKKKICGILQEMYKFQGKTFMIVGIGVNLINSPKIKNYKTAYLELYSTKKIKRKSIISNLKNIYLINFNKLYKCI